MELQSWNNFKELLEARSSILAPAPCPARVPGPDGVTINTIPVRALISIKNSKKISMIIFNLIFSLNYFCLVCPGLTG
jgi:hypothetical protein